VIGSSCDREGVENLLTIGDVADTCRVHAKTVMRAIGRGELRAVRLGERGAYRIRPADLDSWLDALLVGAPRFTRSAQVELGRLVP
jgi:excisionase family DNA binding protein